MKQAENQWRMLKLLHNQFISAHMTDMVEYSPDPLGFSRHVSS